MEDQINQNFSAQYVRRYGLLEFKTLRTYSGVLFAFTLGSPF